MLFSLLLLFSLHQQNTSMNPQSLNKVNVWIYPFCILEFLCITLTAIEARSINMEVLWRLTWWNVNMNFFQVLPNYGHLFLFEYAMKNMGIMKSLSKTGDDTITSFASFQMSKACPIDIELKFLFIGVWILPSSQ